MSFRRLLAILGVWQGFMMKISVFHSLSVKIHLGNWERGVGDSGRLRCLHGKVDTTISCMCYILVVLVPPNFWVCGLWPWCYDCHLSIVIIAK